MFWESIPLLCIYSTGIKLTSRPDKHIGLIPSNISAIEDWHSIVLISVKN